MFLLSGMAFGQDTLKSQKFYLGILVSPDYSYRLLLNNTGSAKTVASTRNSTEIPKLGYTIGLNFLYQMNNRITFNFGVQYSNKGEKTKSQNYIYSSLPPRGISSQPLPISSYFKYNTTYIDMPLLVNIYLNKNKKKIVAFISTGISPNFFLFEKIKEYETLNGGTHLEKSVNGNNNYYKINPQFQLGVGVDIRFKKTLLKIYPVYRTSLLRVNSGPVNGYFYSFGLDISYLFQIKRGLLNKL